MISVVIPTISGREDSLQRCLDAYQQTSPEDTDFVIVRDEPSWPAACNVGYRYAECDYIHFTADDLEPFVGWWQEAMAWLESHDELPAPRVFNHTPDGEWDNAIDGEDKGVPHFTRIPFMRRDQYERIGPWPEIPYASDVWLSERGRTLGIETRNIHSYAFVHHWEQVGRIDTPENLALSDRMMAEWRAAGRP